MILFGNQFITRTFAFWLPILILIFFLLLFMCSRNINTFEKKCSFSYWIFWRDSFLFLVSFGVSECVSVFDKNSFLSFCLRFRLASITNRTVVVWLVVVHFFFGIPISVLKNLIYWRTKKKTENFRILTNKRKVRNLTKKNENVSVLSRFVNLN